MFCSSATANGYEFVKKTNLVARQMTMMTLRSEFVVAIIGHGQKTNFLCCVIHQNAVGFVVRMDNSPFSK